jgi:hypothetical protein
MHYISDVPNEKTTNYCGKDLKGYEYMKQNRNFKLELCKDTGDLNEYFDKCCGWKIKTTASEAENNEIYNKMREHLEEYMCSVSASLGDIPAKSAYESTRDIFIRGNWRQLSRRFDHVNYSELFSASSEQPIGGEV